MPKESGPELIVAIVGAALLLAGGWVMYQEASPILRGGETPLERIVLLGSEPGPVGLSPLSQRGSLMDCEQTMRSDRSLAIRYQPEGTMAAAGDTCRQIAQTISLRNPANSLAWLVEAQVAIADDDTVAFNKALARSWATAPNELWLARMRLDQGEAHIEALDPTQRARQLQDLVVVGSDDAQVHDMANLYLSDPGFRPRMDQALEVMQAADQRMFLTIVQTRLGQGK